MTDPAVTADEAPPPPARIALVHALAESVGPAHAAFARAWPSAFVWDLLDTSLSADLAATGRLDAAMIERFRTLARYAADTSGEGGPTAGILFTCSAFGPAIEAARAELALPVLKPNEAAFEAALDRGDRLGLVVTFAPSRPALEAEFHAMAAARGRRVEIVAAVAEGALAALAAGDGAGHDVRAAETAASLGPVDAVVLGQFSLARARDTVAARTGRPVITTPDAAVRALARRITRPA